MSTMRNVELGVVGWNGRGGQVAHESRLFTGGLLTPVACVEPSDEMYRAGSERFACAPRRYLSVPDMLAREHLGGAIIASPNRFHLEHLRAFQGTDIPLLLEKPLDSSFERICNVARCARAYKAPVLVGHCMRFAPILQAARKMLKRGDIGRICSARFIQNCHYGSGGYHGWRRQVEESGSWMIEKATHDFDVMCWLLEELPSSIAAIQRLQAFGGDRPAALRCRDCPDRLVCPESVQNTRLRHGARLVKELESTDDLCVFSRAVDTPDNDQCLLDFPSGVIGTYVQWFFSPRSYHHRVYEFHGTEGAMEIDLGDELGGRILLSPRYSAARDRTEVGFDYLGRNHYNGDSVMVKHFYDVACGQAQPETTVAQAFAAEVISYAAMQAAKAGRFFRPGELVPTDLADFYRQAYAP